MTLGQSFEYTIGETIQPQRFSIGSPGRLFESLSGERSPFGKAQGSPPPPPLPKERLLQTRPIKRSPTSSAINYRIKLYYGNS